MATTLPYMGLKQWNLTGDGFSHVELANNFAAIDDHDHTTGNGVQVPTGGIADGAVTLAKVASNAIDSTKIVSASISDAKLASPTNATYSQFTGTFSARASASAGTYLFNTAGSGTPTGVDNASNAVPVIYIAAADFAVAGLTTKLKVRATCAVNATAPTVSYTVGLYPVTSIAGAAGNLRWNVGAAVGAVTFTTPGASSLTQVAGADFTLPSDGFYALGFTVSGSPAANSVVGLTGRGLIRHT